MSVWLTASLSLLGQSGLTTSFLPLLGVALITLALLMMLRKRKQRGGKQPTAREQLERLKQKQAMRGDLEHLMVELEQLTRRFNAQLDAKSLQLEKLIDQADRRIDELKRLQGRSPGEETDNAADSPADAGDAPSSGAAGMSGWSPPPGSRAGGATSSQIVADEDALTQRVYALADEGRAAAEIARELDEHIGKVELMLALRKA